VRHVYYSHICPPSLPPSLPPTLPTFDFGAPLLVVVLSLLLLPFMVVPVVAMLLLLALLLLLLLLADSLVSSGRTAGAAPEAWPVAVLWVEVWKGRRGGRLMVVVLPPLVVLLVATCVGGVDEGLCRVVVLTRGGVRLRPSRPLVVLLLLPRADEGDEALRGLPRGIRMVCRGGCGQVRGLSNRMAVKERKEKSELARGWENLGLALSLGWGGSCSRYHGMETARFFLAHTTTTRSPRARRRGGGKRVHKAKEARPSKKDATTNQHSNNDFQRVVTPQIREDRCLWTSGAPLAIA